MYYLKTQTFGCSVYFSLLLLSWSLLLFPDLPYDINHRSAKVIRVLFLPLFLCSRYYSNRCLVRFLTNSGCANTCWWIITGMLVMFAPFFIFIFGPLLQYNILVGSTLLVVFIQVFVSTAGAPAVEAFIEKVSRR
ncbi:MFS transporter [Klebsiella pneumoniae]|uniref:MFS transporter n=1 Tax=Klebsiella pneumoniae TaxID=573 RepID=UPI00388E5317